jgi:hypothetical protein
MDASNRYSLMMEALTEILQEEETSAPPSTPQPATPTLASVLADSSPLPGEALYLGQAEDDLPVLLNVYDPVTGPILITADEHSGKTNLLQTIATAADMLHTPERVQYVIITPRPEEWQTLPNGSNSAGIYSTKDENASELLQALVTWAHNNKGEEQVILLFIDDLAALTTLGDQARQNLRWLLLRGASRRVWCFVTLNASRARELTDWLEFFHTRLFGFMEKPEDTRLLTGNPAHTLTHLLRGIEFTMREGDKLLRFWLPSVK